MSLRSLSCFLAISCSAFVHAEDVPTFAGPTPGTLRTISIPTVDISADAARHVVIARGTEKEYQGHCDTVLMADRRTMFTAWCMNHAGHLGPLARSDDSGLTWTSPLPTPPDWQLVKMTTPVLHRLTDPQGVERLFIFGGCDFPGNLRSAFSTDLGKTWSPMKELGLVGEVAPKSILSFDGGKRLIMWSDRRDPKNAKDLHPVVWQSESLDGGLTWSKERVILVVPGQWAQPSVTRSDDGKQLVMLLRENTRKHHSLFSVSTDNARSWSQPKELPAALTGDRHVIKHAPDGRLVIAFRDMAKTSNTYGHYVAWVGTFEDIVNHREGQYRIKLLQNTKRSPTDKPGTGNTDCGYSDLELLGDGTLIATTYIQYAAGPEKSSVVSTRFKLSETDVLAKKVTASIESLLPANWDPAIAGDIVMQRLVRVSAPQVKGAHDAEFVCVGERAYIVEHDNDVSPGHGAGAAMYCVLSVVNLKSLQVEKTHLLAKAGQAFANVTLPEAQAFVPRIIRKDEHTLRTYFCSKSASELTWYRDFDLRTQSFEDSIHKAKLKTAAGTFDMEPRHFHADAAAQGFKRPAVNHGLYIFDSFKEFDGKRYIALNNFPGKQNALAVLHDDFTTFEVIGHYNEPQSQQLSESAVNRLPDGTWMAIVRNDGGNYHFTTSQDGKTWAVAEPMPFVPSGLNSKPTFDKFGGVYYIGWQENTKIQNCNRSVFNVDISRDGKTWQRKYRFESPHSFQYPTFHEHEGTLWLTVSQSDHGGTTDRIMFGKLEAVVEFESQKDHQRIAWPAPPPPAPAVMKRGVKLFDDRDYVIDEMPDAVKDLPFHRTSIEKLDVTVTKPGTLFALTPTIRPTAASQDVALQKAGFTKVDVPETQLFPGEINRVSLYRKAVKQGERLQFKKMVLLVLADGAELRDEDGLTPSVIMNPSAEFQDDARSGAMIIGMDRTPKGRIWGCWTGTGDKPDGCFLLATSDDDGATWSKPRLAVGARMEAAQKVSGALVGNLWTDPKGRLWLFFDQQLGDPQKRITNWFMRCDDPDAAEPVWSTPVMFAEGCTLNKPTVLKDGTWLLPVSDWHKKTCRVFASTDEGASWKERGSLQFPDWEFDEHMMIELKDGRLWMLARTKGQPHESFSNDGGKTWSEPKQAATVQNVNARFFLRRLKSGRILLVKNGPVNVRLPRRSSMMAFVSDDEGKTWSNGLLLDDRSSVSYPDGFEAPDGLIHILYDWNRHTDAEILMARFREEDVLAGKIVSKDAKLRMLANKALAPHLPPSITPATKWIAIAAEDAKQDRKSIPYDGVTPNKMVCDTTLRQMPDGSWIISLLAGDDFEPSPKNYIGITRSTDEGRAWSPLETVDTTFPHSGITSGQGATEIMTIANRTTMFFSTHSQTWGRDWQSWMMHSDDSAKTWSKPEPMPGRLAKFTFIRGHIVTKDGRILIPFQHYQGPPAGTTPPEPEDKPWHKALSHYVSNPRNGVLISSDGGKTYTEHGDIRLTPDDRYHGWAENSIVELSDGRILMVLRGDRLGGVLYQAVSKDGGKTWPDFASITDTPNPGSKAMLYSLGGDNVALLHNPNSKHRSPMALWISFDAGKTWPYQRVLQQESVDGPKGRMNYPDGFVSADRQWLHFAFDDNRHRCVHYSAKLPPLP